VTSFEVAVDSAATSRRAAAGLFDAAIAAAAPTNIANAQALAA
jgi:hypothetical protein